MTTRTTAILATLAVLLLVVVTPGCVRLHGPKDLKRSLSKEAGVELDKEFGITVTRSGVWLARKIVKWTDEDDEIPSLKGVKRVQVGVYQVKDLRPGFEEPRRLTLEDLNLPDWDPIVRIQEDNEQVFVLTRLKEEEIRGMLVVVAEEDEWVLVRIKGRLDQVIEDAMQMAFEESGHPDLFHRANEERQRNRRDRERERDQEDEDAYLTVSETAALGPSSPD